MDPSPGVSALEVMNELLEVLDGVDVVVRGRRDESDAWGRVTGLSYPRVDLRAGELTTLARFSSLGHFDLNVVGIDQVLAGYAESSRCHLLDSRTTFWIVETLRILATLSGIRFASNPVHRDGQGLVRLYGNRAVAHRTCGKSLDDLVGWLDFRERHCWTIVTEL